ncbi:MAG TPA: type II 3-dehydroquinate dehydratase [Candidatus Cybelea sp.]|nr:type II 3-dehydroquinate dehydratase [Candidatus Cybelea sp.]
MAKTIYVLNGPSMNLLGKREPKVYGRDTLEQVRRACEKKAKALGLGLEFRQSNHEGVLVDWIQEARVKSAGIIINPAGFTSTSIAILDALLASEKPVIEVHLTNIHRREEFRHKSFVSLAARGVICGLGPIGYLLALEALADLVK